MPRPYLGEIAYQAYCRYLDTPQPAWRDLPLTERLAWGMAVLAGVQEARRVPALREVKLEWQGKRRGKMFVA